MILHGENIGVVPIDDMLRESRFRLLYARIKAYNRRAAEKGRIRRGGRFSGRLEKNLREIIKNNTIFLDLYRT